MSRNKQRNLPGTGTTGVIPIVRGGTVTQDNISGFTKVERKKPKKGKTSEQPLGGKKAASAKKLQKQVKEKVKRSKTRGQ